MDRGVYISFIPSSSPHSRERDKQTSQQSIFRKSTFLLRGKKLNLVGKYKSPLGGVGCAKKIYVIMLFISVLDYVLHWCCFLHWYRWWKLEILSAFQEVSNTCTCHFFWGGGGEKEFKSKLTNCKTKWYALIPKYRSHA